MTGISEKMFTGYKADDGSPLYCGDIIDFSFESMYEGGLRSQGVIEWYDDYKEFCAYCPTYNNGKRMDYHYYGLDGVEDIVIREEPYEIESELIKYLREKNEVPKRIKRKRIKK